ncbi:hypothetical protein J2Z22_003682 [Paenibacillus forsythiae]|uniref:Uncharacterized protein n=1 Tax=Paenibacillus forsythiae TaxID=365616 RepID=A0ABU3HB98_9BACL|nr:DUF6311 domain-containing protein [Paenibacillus forsythiae]MDT3428092.1 hypothetical protein [Paenibacillus forsythiae]
MKHNLINSKDLVLTLFVSILVFIFSWNFGSLYISIGLSIVLSLFLSAWNKTYINEKINNYFMLIFSGVLGLIFFCTILSVRVLNTSYIDWLLNRGDPAQHFLGWHFFRNNPWAFPPGIISSLNTPIGTSITYTDSIPLFAFFFKIFNLLLPEIFQYLGIWILLCYILQGIFGLLLMKRMTQNLAVQLLGTMFFIMSPIMLWRAYGHEGLMGHWIILWVLLLYKSQYKHLHWLSLVLVSLLVHPYLFIMVYIFFVVKLLEMVVIRTINYKSLIFYFTTSLLLIAFTLWIIGYFYIGSSGVSDGFGFYSMNINSLFNPQGWSQYLIKDQPYATPGQYEGFNYLGSGIIFLLICSLYITINNSRDTNNKGNFGLIVIIIIFTFIALSNVITFSNKILLTIPLPDIILKLCGIVRASGRFFWPVYYLIIIFCLSSIIRNTKRRSVVLLLIISLSIQFADFSGKFNEFHKMYSSDTKWETPLKSEVWSKINGLKYHNLVFVPAKVSDKYVAFSMLAAEKRMTINAIYTAREDYTKRELYNNKLIEDFKIRNWNLDNIYIVDNSLFGTVMKEKKESDLFLTVDSFNVLIPNGKEDTNFKGFNFDSYDFNYNYGDVIKFGLNGNSNLIKDGGWSDTEENATWTEGKEASLFFSLKKPQRNLKLSVKMLPLIGGDLKGQHLKVSANHKLISEIIVDSSNTYQFSIPNNIVKDRLEITFNLPDATSPKLLGINEDTRILGLFVENVILEQQP